MNQTSSRARALRAARLLVNTMGAILSMGAAVGIALVSGAWLVAVLVVIAAAFGAPLAAAGFVARGSRLLGGLEGATILVRPSPPTTSATCGAVFLDAKGGEHVCARNRGHSERHRCVGCGLECDDEAVSIDP